MNDYQRIVNRIKESERIVITSHKSPDGDSVGSSLALYHFIQKLGKNAVMCHPDPAPEFLKWLEGSSEIKTFTHHAEIVTESLQQADLIFCLDYNGTDRVGEEMQRLLENSVAGKIMIDHHLNPQNFAEITVSETEVSSTAQLIAELIIQSGNPHLLDSRTGTPLYVGILTDTGTFRFPAVQPRTHEILAALLAAGVNHVQIHENLNDTNTLSRIRLQGYAMSNKLEVLDSKGIAIISLTEQEHTAFNYQKGDTDGLPNIALTVKGMKAAVLVSEREGYIRISFRSKGKENPVNVLASEHFAGGGHTNAAGGRSDLTMEETLKKLRELLPLYIL